MAALDKGALSLEPAFRSRLEKKVADQLQAAGVPYEFEAERIPYNVPARSAKYLPDFIFTGCRIILEAKGRFGGRQTNKGAEERQKLILLKEQHSDLDIRLVFQDARKPIYTGSKTTYAAWADTHGFLWSDKGKVPETWINEIKGELNDSRKRPASEAKRAESPSPSGKQRKRVPDGGSDGVRHRKACRSRA